jgi:hypothetical protein
VREEGFGLLRLLPRQRFSVQRGEACEGDAVARIACGPHRVVPIRRPFKEVKNTQRNDVYRNPRMALLNRYFEAAAISAWIWATAFLVCRSK